MKSYKFIFLILVLNVSLNAQEVDSITRHNRFIISVNTLPLISNDESSAMNTVVLRQSVGKPGKYLRGLMAMDFGLSTKKDTDSILLPDEPREIDDAYDITVALGYEKVINSLAGDRLTPYAHLSAYGRRVRQNTGSYSFDVRFDTSLKDEFEMNRSRVGLLGGFGVRYQLTRRLRLSTEIHLIGGYKWWDERNLRIERDVVITNNRSSGRGVFLDFNPLPGIYLEFALGKIRPEQGRR